VFETVSGAMISESIQSLGGKHPLKLPKLMSDYIVTVQLLDNSSPESDASLLVVASVAISSGSAKSSLRSDTSILTSSSSERV